MKKKTMKWMLTAILCICGVSVFTACTPDNNDNPAGDGTALKGFYSMSMAGRK